MRIIEAMRKIKANTERCTSLNDLIAQYCADYDVQTPTYPDQTAQVTAWLTAVHDLLAEIETLKFKIAKTNVMTPVTIEIGGNHITKSIYQWIQRRSDLAKCEALSWSRLGDRGLKANQLTNTADGKTVLVQVRRYFDPQLKDSKIALFQAEPHLIDGALEITNATTDLVD